MREPTAGVVIGQVTDVNNPDHVGQVEIYFPWQGKDAPRRWCSLASIMAGSDSGAFMFPVVGDEVLVAFDHGDFDHAYIIGVLWNQVHRPPSQDQRQRMIRSKNGHTIRFVDLTEAAGDRGALIIEDGHGNMVVMANGVVTVHSQGHLNLSASTMNIMGRPVRPVGGDI